MGIIGIEVGEFGMALVACFNSGSEAFACFPFRVFGVSCLRLVPTLQEDSRPQPGAFRRVGVGGRQERGLGTQGQQDHRAVVRPDQGSEGCLHETPLLEVRGRLWCGQFRTSYAAYAQSNPLKPKCTNAAQDLVEAPIPSYAQKSNPLKPKCTETAHDLVQAPTLNPRNHN